MCSHREQTSICSRKCTGKCEGALMCGYVLFLAKGKILETAGMRASIQLFAFVFVLVDPSGNLQ